MAMSAASQTARLTANLEGGTSVLCYVLGSAWCEAGCALTTQRGGGMFVLFFSDEKVDTYAQAVACDAAAFNRSFHAMLERGVYLAPSAYEAGFMSSAHDDDAIERTVAAAPAAFLAARA